MILSSMQSPWPLLRSLVSSNPLLSPYFIEHNHIKHLSSIKQPTKESFQIDRQCLWKSVQREASLRQASKLTLFCFPWDLFDLRKVSSALVDITSTTQQHKKHQLGRLSSCMHSSTYFTHSQMDRSSPLRSIFYLATREFCLKVQPSETTGLIM